MQDTLNPRFVHLLFALLLSALATAARAQTAAAEPAPAPAVAPAVAPPAAPRAEPQLRPFAEVVKGARQIPGYFTLYQKDDRVWIEIKPEQLNSPFFFQVNSTRGLGQGGIVANAMLAGHVVELTKSGTRIQLVAKNLRFAARTGTPIARAVQESFADSLLATTTEASAPHPERKSLLIDANALLLADIPAMASRLETSFRVPYAYDARNSGFVAVRATNDMATFQVSAHYAVPKLPVPPLTPSTTPSPAPPSNLEDNRSMLLGYYYSFSKLPDTVMPARVADSRIGHFVTQAWDYSDDIKAFPRKYLLHRWRLEKKDPLAALSEPLHPITYWLDRNIPVKYRAKVAEGVLEWNKAFEKLGFKDALRVMQQADNADFDNNDSRHASIRWVVDTSDGALATGPSLADPRSGEILDADIRISDGWTRLPRRRAVEQLPSVAQGNNHERLGSAAGLVLPACEYANGAMDEVEFALDLLWARGDIDPAGPEAEAIVLDQLKEVVMHEVGHTLGLSHNFRASTAYTLAQLEDEAHTRDHGISGSVMDYNALNIAAQGGRQGKYVMTTLGAYDYWAIEYAYRVLTPEREESELLAIAARSNEPQLAFGNDVDAGVGNVEGMDPEVSRRDLGADPLAYAALRVQLSRELWQRLQERRLKPGEQFDVLLRNFLSANAQLDLAASIAAKHVGGVVHLRDHADGGRAPLSPVPAARQRQALKLITDGLFRAGSFRFKPEFVARLVPDQFDRWFAAWKTANPAAQVNPDASISGAVLALQRASLDRLMADAVAARILDAPSKLGDPRSAFSLAELYDSLQAAIWSELARGGSIDPLRRNLQREHLRRVVNALLRPAATTPADARSLQRANARRLQREIRAALSRGADRETLAHLSECLDLLAEALKAPLLRTG